MLSEDHVEAAYCRARNAAWDGRRLPSPRAIQELMQVWKLLWKWHR
jgi:hypothetical protein